MAAKKTNTAAQKKALKKKRDLEEALENVDDALEILDESEVVAEGSVSNELKNWIEDSIELGQGYKATLYKFMNPKGHKKTIVFQYEDYIPAEHEVGMEYGSGRYELFASGYDSNGNLTGARRRFELHVNYDRIMQENSNNNPGVYPQNQINQQQSDPLAMMQSVMGMFLPLIQTMQSNQPAQPDISALMTNHYENMGSVMKKNAIDQSNMFAEIARLSGGITPDEEERHPVHDILETVLPLIDRFLPKLAEKGAKSTALATTVKMMPEFDEVKGDPEAMRILYEEAVEKHGIVKAKAAMKKLGVKLPK